MPIVPKVPRMQLAPSFVRLAAPAGGCLAATSVAASASRLVASVWWLASGGSPPPDFAGTVAVTPWDEAAPDGVRCVGCYLRRQEAA
jgi:hypothetical protein